MASYPSVVCYTALFLLFNTLLPLHAIHVKHQQHQRTVLADIDLSEQDLASAAAAISDEPLSSSSFECIQLPYALCIGQHVITADKTPDKLIAHYSFDYPETLGLDTSGANHHLHTHSYSLGPGAPVSSSPDSYSALFNGSTSATLDHLLELAHDQLSFSFWVFIAETGFQGFRTILHKGSEATSHFSVALWPESSRLRVKVMSKEDGEHVSLDSVSSLVLGRWNHVGVVMEGPFLELQVNGVVDSSVREESGFDLGETPMYLGKDPWNDGLVGYLDELVVLRRPISRLERLSVQSLTFPGLIPDSMYLGCETCSFVEAVSACSSRSSAYHLCSAMDLELGGYAVANTMGWIQPFVSPLHLWNASSKAADYDLAKALCCMQ